MPMHNRNPRNRSGFREKSSFSEFGPKPPGEIPYEDLRADKILLEQQLDMQVDGNRDFQENGLLAGWISPQSIKHALCA